MEGSQHEAVAVEEAGKGNPKKAKGFAALEPHRRALIASLGGRRSHELQRGHKFSTDEARAAGLKGGQAVVERHGVKHMARIGRKGGSISRPPKDAA